MKTNRKGHELLRSWPFLLGERAGGLYRDVARKRRVNERDCASMNSSQDSKVLLVMETSPETTFLCLDRKSSKNAEMFLWASYLKSGYRIHSAFSESMR